jgi:Ca-activated chloride channel family protein
MTFPAHASDRVAFTDPGDLPQLRLVDGADALPLKHTDVRAEITGIVAEVEVRQTYQNTRDEAIEAVYTFPLPENSAVRDMEIVIGDRTIRAEIQRRDEARRTYERARARGNTAALLEQERSNVFMQSVANIPPGEEIDVVIRYVQDMTYDAGQYEFVFPMVVGPRYTAGADDADRVTPSVVGKGTRTGHDIDVEVSLDAGMPVRDVRAPNHDVQTRQGATGQATVTLAKAKSIPNRDFVLRYRVDADQVQSTLFVSEGEDPYFTLLMQPPTVDVDALVGQREMIFVVDVSGSMSGKPLAMCKYAMRKALRQLRPTDTFNVYVFAGRTGQAFDEPMPANQENTAAAESFIQGLRAGGGTEILNAVDAALKPSVGGDRHRYVFFMTDGFVAIEEDVFARTRKWVRSLEERGQRARVFAMGTGSSPNRELLDKLTKAGDGVAVYASNREDPARAVDTYYRYVDHAVFTNPKLNWGRAKPSGLHPERLPDLYASRPGVVHGKLTGAAPKSLTLQGKVGTKTVRVPVRVERLASAPSAVQGQLWARAEIEELTLRGAVDGNRRVDEITALGLEHRLVTAYTSFVAVDQSRVVGYGQPERVEQPVDAPEAVDMAMAGARVYDEADSESYAQPTSAAYRLEMDRGAGCAHCDIGDGGGQGGGVLFVVLMLLRRRRQ